MVCWLESSTLWIKGIVGSITGYGDLICHWNLLKLVGFLVNPSIVISQQHDGKALNAGVLKVDGAPPDQIMYNTCSILPLTFKNIGKTKGGWRKIVIISHRRNYCIRESNIPHNFSEKEGFSNVFSHPRCVGILPWNSKFLVSVDFHWTVNSQDRGGGHSLITQGYLMINDWLANKTELLYSPISLLLSICTKYLPFADLQ